MTTYNHPTSHYAFFHESSNVLEKKYKELKINKEYSILTGTYLDANDEQRTFTLRVPNEVTNLEKFCNKYFDNTYYSATKRYSIESTFLLEEDMVNGTIEQHDFTPAPVEVEEGTENAY